MEVQKLMEGIRRKIGCAVTKKMPVEGHHIAALMRMAIPDNDGQAWTGTSAAYQWFETVALVVLGWAAFLRRSEILQLQTCDLAWYDDRLDICVRKAKADQRSYTATTTVHAATDASELCLWRYFKGYWDNVLLGGTRHPRCTKLLRKEYECDHCGYVFPTIDRKQVQRRTPLNTTTMGKRFKAAVVLLEVAGVVPRGQYETMSIGSLRKGGNSTAAALGIRDVLREKHGRWGLTARRNLGTAEPEYNMALSGEKGGVSWALHAALNGVRPSGAVADTNGVNSTEGRAMQAHKQKQRKR